MTAGAIATQPGAGFYPDPGKDFTSSPTVRKIAAALDKLAKAKGIAIYGISGVRTSAQSAALGYPNGDRHTLGVAADIGVNSQLRSSAGTLSASDLASVGLYRPFGGSTEINHVELMPGTAVEDPAGHGSAAGAVAGAASGAAKVITDPAAAAQAVLDSTLQGWWTIVTGSAGKWLLYGVLIFGGAALVVYGLVQAAGVRPSIPKVIPV